MSARPSLTALCRLLFPRGLGELPMLRCREDKAFIGNLVMEKGSLVFKDRELLKGVSADQVAPCWDLGLTGTVVDLRDQEWESLTFLGPDLCRIPVDLSTTRHGMLGRIAVPTGENFLTCRSSVYRGFKLMLDYNLLPVLVPLSIESREGLPGIAVADFRFATAPLDQVVRVNDVVRTAIERHLTLSVEELDVDDSEFEALFGKYHKTD